MRLIVASEPARVRSVLGAMELKQAKPDWPWWSTWALLAVVVTAILTIGAAINDIW